VYYTIPVPPRSDQEYEESLIDYKKHLEKMKRERVAFQSPPGICIRMPVGTTKEQIVALFSEKVTEVKIPFRNTAIVYFKTYDDRESAMTKTYRIEGVEVEIDRMK